MTVELNGAFIPDHLQKRLEQYLQTSWARAEVAPGWLSIRWNRCDPGELVLAVELRAVSIARQLQACDVAAPKEMVQRLMDSLDQEIAGFLRVHGS